VGILMFGMAYLLIHRMIKVDMTATTLTKKALYDSNLNIEPYGAIPRAPAPKPELIREKPGYHIGKQNESDLYQPLQEYEWLVGAEYREGVLELAFPSPDTTIFLDGAIRFRWHITSGEDDHVTVIIVNNKGKVVRETKIDRDEQGVSVQAGTLGPGLFYWKLIFADNIAGMGKVTIVLPFIK
jgi:hypothetical protein